MYELDACSSFRLPYTTPDPDLSKDEQQEEAERAVRTLLGESSGGFFFSSDLSGALLRARLALKLPQLSSVLDAPEILAQTAESPLLVNESAELPPAALEEPLKKEPSLLTLTMVNGEYGLQVPAFSLAQAAKGVSPNTAVFLDASMALGRMRFDGIPPEVDLLAFRAETLGAMQCTVLWAREPEKFEVPELWGRCSVDPAVLASIQAACKLWLADAEKLVAKARAARIVFDEVLSGQEGVQQNFRDKALSPDISSYHIGSLDVVALVEACLKCGLRLSNGIPELAGISEHSALTALLFGTDPKYSNLRVSPSPLLELEAAADAALLLCKALHIARQLEI
jgi:cysteine sulfinate desulfinase/cysteine desulfurase-like protein